MMQGQRQLVRSHDLSMTWDWSSLAARDTTLEFGRFRLELRQRQLLADGVPIELGTRAFDLLLVLLEADGSLVTKDELVSRVWPGITVADENLKVQIAAVRKALGEDRDFIRTEFGRGYRFTAEAHSSIGKGAPHRPTPSGDRSRQSSPRQWIFWRSPCGCCAGDNSGIRFVPVDTECAASWRDWIRSAKQKGEET